MRGKSEDCDKILCEILKSTFGTEKNGMNFGRNKINSYTVVGKINLPKEEEYLCRFCSGSHLMRECECR